MVNSLTANLPRYFIARQLGDHDLGIFAGLTYVTAAGTMVVAALGQSSSPRLASLYATGDITQFCRLLWKLIAVGAGLGGLGHDPGRQLGQAGFTDHLPS